MKTYKKFTFIFFVLITGTSLAQNETIIWDSDTNTKDTQYDLNNEKTFKNLKLTINANSRSVDSIRLDCPNPETKEKFKQGIDPKDIATSNGNTVISIQTYLEKAFESTNLTKLLEKPDQTIIKITLFGKNGNKDEILDINLKILPLQKTIPPVIEKIFQFIPPPIPNFSSENLDPNPSKKHRILLFDGTGEIQENKGFQLYAFNESENQELGSKSKSNKLELSHDLVPKKSLPVNSSLSVFSSNINFDSLKSLKIALNGKEFIYNAGVADILNELEKLKQSDSSKEAENASANEDKDKINAELLTKIKEYLIEVKVGLETLHYLNIYDYQKLQTFKKQLKRSVENFTEVLDTDAFKDYFIIMNMSPKYINLTPIALTIPNADEVSVESTLKFNSSETEEKYTTGVFRTSHSMTVRVGSSLFFTGLKNNNVYTETVTIGGNEELRAKMDEDDQLSVGIGVNSEVSWRIGSMFRPNFNLAFFVPFAEEITPFVGVGPGISFYDKNVSLNLSGGLAFGKVNSINEQYRDRNLSAITDLTNTDLIQKVWKGNWYLSVGVGFNINKEK